MKIQLHDSSYFGDCPVCGRNDGYVNIGRGHWCLCKKHKVMWCIGSNLFSSWKDETEEEQRKFFDKHGLASFKRVEPWRRAIQKNTREKVVFNLGKLKGKHYLDMRVFTAPENGGGDGKDIPTKEGLTLPVELYPKLKAALAQVEAVMIAQGLLDKEDREAQDYTMPF